MPDASEAATSELPAGASPAAAAVVEPTPPALATDADDKKKWLIVCGKTPITGDRGAGVIVVESHEYPEVDDDGNHVKDAPRTLTGYAKGADLYVRQSDDVEFPADAQVVTIGETVQQGGFGGFAKKVGEVHVGPASAAFAAANLAWQRGATDIKIIGLDDRQKAHLQPFIDDLPTHPHGAADVSITLA